MDTKPQIVAADPASIDSVLRRLPEGPFSWTYLGQDAANYYRARKIFQSRGAYLETAHRFDQAAESLREPYLSYIYGIGVRLRSLRWWLTSVSYRSGYVSTVFHQACYLRVALDLVRSWEGPGPLVLVMADRPVRTALERNMGGGESPRVRWVGPRRTFPLRPVFDVVSMLAHRAFIAGREAAWLLRARRMIPRPYVPNEPTTLLVSWANSGNLRNGGEFHRSFFGDTADKLSEMGNRVAVVPMVLPDVPYRWALHQLREAPIPLMVPHRYLGLMDLVRAVASSFARPPFPRSIPEFSEMDISVLIREDLRTHWVSNQVVDALLVAAVVRRWAGLGASISRIIYTYENQPWERALCWETRRSLPEAVLVGYQHSRVPRMLLNYYLAPGGETEAPLPDRVVTVGEHTARMLSADGYGPIIRVGGALQMQSVLGLRSRTDKETERQDGAPVLVAGGNGFGETAELLDLAFQLFAEDDGVPIVVKCHPIMPFEKVSGSIRPLPKNVQVSDEPIEELMLKSSLMVYTGSTVCIQALALGLPVVHVRPQFDFDLDPLEAVPEARLEARGPDELREKVRWILDHRQEYRAQNRDLWNRVVEEMYGTVTDHSYRAFVE